MCRMYGFVENTIKGLFFQEINSEFRLFWMYLQFLSTLCGQGIFCSKSRLDEVLPTSLRIVC